MLMQLSHRRRKQGARRQFLARPDQPVARAADVRERASGRANIEKMSLSELAALDAEAVQSAAATIAPLERNAFSDEAEKRVIALKREMSSGC